MKKTILLLSMLAASFGAQYIGAQSETKGTDISKAHFDMGPKFVHMPEGFFVLVRKGKEIGAIRFTKIEQDTLGNGKSAYESYFQNDGSESFLNANVVKRFGEINILPMRGIHAFAWQPGHNKLWVGKWWFGCSSPSLISMSAHFEEEDHGFEFAATSARAIREVDASDKRLRWFRYIDDSTIALPVSELPK